MIKVENIERGAKLTGFGKSDLDLMKRLYKAGTEHILHRREGDI